MTPGTVVRVRGSSAIAVVVDLRDDAGDGCLHLVARSGRGEAWVHPVDLEVVGPPVDSAVLATLRAGAASSKRAAHDARMMTAERDARTLLAQVVELEARVRELEAELARTRREADDETDDGGALP